MNGNRTFNKLLADGGAIVCSAAMTAAFLTGWAVYQMGKSVGWRPSRVSMVMAVLFFVIFHLSASLYEAFNISVLRKTQLIFNQILAVAVTEAAMYVVISLFQGSWNGMYLCIAFPLQCVTAVIFICTAERLYFLRHSPKETMIVCGSNDRIGDLIRERGLERRFRIAGKADVQVCILEPDRFLSDADVVFMSDVHSRERNILLKYCVEKQKETYVIPRIGDMLMSSASVMHMFPVPVFKIERYSPPLIYQIGKRLFDITASAGALVLLAPVLVLTALAIRLHDGGPILYRQRRLTLGGKEFEVLKFRSMRTDAEKDGVARLSTGEADDRITPVGKLIRKIRVDELPQLINILMGDMSIVGPRPERPEIAAVYEKKMPEFRLRLQVKAGLTGYAQVYGRYNTTPYDKLLMDLNYIAQPGLIRDLKICLATIRVLFEAESTAGVDEGKMTAGE